MHVILAQSQLCILVWEWNVTLKTPTNIFSFDFLTCKRHFKLNNQVCETSI